MARGHGGSSIVKTNTRITGHTSPHAHSLAYHLCMVAERAQMHDVNSMNVFANNARMSIVLEPRDKYIIVLMTCKTVHAH